MWRQEKNAIDSHFGSQVDSASYSWHHDICQGLMYCTNQIKERENESIHSCL